MKQPDRSDAAAGASAQITRYALLLGAAAVLLVVALGFAAYSGWQSEQEKQLQVARMGARAAIGTIDLGFARVERSLAEFAERLAADRGGLVAEPGTLQGELRRLGSALPALDGLGVVDRLGKIVATAADDPLVHAAIAGDEGLRRNVAGLATGKLAIAIPAASFADGVARLIVWQATTGSDGRAVGAVYGLLSSARVIAQIRLGMPNPRFAVDLLLAERLDLLAPSSRSDGEASLPEGKLRDLLTTGHPSGAARIASSRDGQPRLAAFEISPRFGMIAVSSTTLAETWSGWIAENRIQMLVFAVFLAIGLVLKLGLFMALRRGLHAESRLREMSEVASQDSIRDLVDRLSRSEARFRDGIESMEEGVALWGADDRLVLWNHRYLEILPHMRELVREGIHIRELNLAAFGLVRPELPPDELAEVVDARLAHRKTGVLRTLALPDGRVIEIKDQRTSEGGMVSIHRDVTERSKHQAELHRALEAEREMNAQQRRFVSVASHEFRTPLTIIDGAAQRLLRELPDPVEPKLALRIDRIRGAVSRLTAIIERTLFAARMDEQGIALAPVTFDLGALLASICERQRLISPAFAVRLTLPAERLLIDGDRNMLDLAVTNLVANAVRYSGAAREIEISAGVVEEVVEIAVRDRGIGIPADEIGKLFVRYFRASTAARIAGTGIGLHLVKDLVGKHAGTVAVESEVGRGSVFTVRLPRRRPDAAARAA